MTVVDLLWGTPERPKRGPKPALSQAAIVEAAIAVADAEGLAALSMQRVAERLGFTKMSLYRYLPGRAELTALMLDAALGPAPELPPAAEHGEPWRAGLRAWTHAIHDRYRAHPWSLDLTVGIRPIGPNELAWFEVALAALAHTPLTSAERMDAVVLVNGHVRNLTQQTRNPNEDTEAQLAQQFGAVLADRAEQFPHATAAFAAATGQDNALEFGLDRILDGLAVLIAGRSS
ncbi:MAG: TetR family transcriptional regulator [Mycobacteriaceae bacterium]|nr:TetR family transcriptional regulator [Mycobacteriaceae bacterium]